MSYKLEIVSDQDSLTFKPLLGKSRLSAVLKNAGEEKIGFRITPAKPDLFIVNPDFGEIQPGKETEIELEIVQGFATFRWTTQNFHHEKCEQGSKSVKAHLFTILVTSETNGVPPETIELETRIDTRFDHKKQKNHDLRALCKSTGNVMRNGPKSRLL